MNGLGLEGFAGDFRVTFCKAEIGKPPIAPIFFFYFLSIKDFHQYWIKKKKLSTPIINPKLARNMQMNTQDNKNHFLLKSV